MTEENRSDLPPTEGGPAPKKSVAAAKESATPRVAPLATPFPDPASLEPDPGHDYAWEEGGEGLVFTPEDAAGAVVPNESRRLKRSNAKLPSSWVQGPGAIEVLIEGIKLLRGAAKAAGTPMKEILAVRVMALPKVDVVLVAPAKEGAPGAIQTRRDGHGSLMFTISDVLREAGMEVTSGFRELFPVKKVTESPIGPCIAITLAKSLVTRQTGKTKDEA